MSMRELEELALFISQVQTRRLKRNETGHLAGQTLMKATQSSRPLMADTSSLATHALTVLAMKMSDSSKLALKFQHQLNPSLTSIQVKTLRPYRQQ